MQRKIARYAFVLCLFGSGIVAALAVQAKRQFLVDGTVVGDDVLQENGRYWVPLDDVGRHFGYFVSVNASQANLTKIPTPPPPNGQPAVTPPPPQAGAAQQFVAGTGSQASPLGQPGSEIAVGIGQNASVRGYDYRVVDIRDMGQQYRETFDQRANTLHAKYKTDSLVVVDIEETNRGEKPVQAIIPDPSSISVVDSKKVGYAATFMDVRQSADVVNKSNTFALDLPTEGTENITLDPGGTVKFAVIASIPAGDQVTGAVLNLSGGDGNGNASGAVVTVTR